MHPESPKLIKQQYGTELHLSTLCHQQGAQVITFSVHATTWYIPDQDRYYMLHRLSAFWKGIVKRHPSGIPTPHLRRRLTCTLQDHICRVSCPYVDTFHGHTPVHISHIRELGDRIEFTSQSTHQVDGCAHLKVTTLP